MKNNYIYKYAKYKNKYLKFKYYNFFIGKGGTRSLEMITFPISEDNKSRYSDEDIFSCVNIKDNIYSLSKPNSVKTIRESADKSLQYIRLPRINETIYIQKILNIIQPCKNSSSIDILTGIYIVTKIDDTMQYTIKNTNNNNIYSFHFDQISNLEEDSLYYRSQDLYQVNMKQVSNLDQAINIIQSDYDISDLTILGGVNIENYKKLYDVIVKYLEILEEQLIQKKQGVQDIDFNKLLNISKKLSDNLSNIEYITDQNIKKLFNIKESIMPIYIYFKFEIDINLKTIKNIKKIKSYLKLYLE